MLPPTDSISRGDLLGGARRGAFEQHLAPSAEVMPLLLAVFRQHAALENGAKFDERQAMVFLHQQAQAVGQFEFLDRVFRQIVDQRPRLSARCRTGSSA